MKAYNNWENIQPSNGGTSNRLPAGGYIGVIVGAKESAYKVGTPDEFHRLEIALDVAEGEYTDYFKDKFDAAKDEFKKWKGVFRCTLPKDDKDEKKLSYLKGVITSIEQSNPGYKWDWNEIALKGKAVGFLVRDAQFRNDDGKIITFTEICALRSTNAIHEGDFIIPEMRAVEDVQLNTAYNPADFNMSGLTPPPQNSGSGNSGGEGYPF